MTKTNPTPSPNEPAAQSGNGRRVAIFLQTLVYYLSKYWYGFAMLFSFAFLLLAFAAPALMAENQVERAQKVYRFLAVNNHQLPERSYFMFGENGGVQTYTLQKLENAGMDPTNRQSFLGDERIGYKLGLNHRMMAIFIGMLVGGLAWGLSRGKLRMGLLVFLLLLLPILFDGFSHMLSENGSGFREVNQWARILTGNQFSDSFYTQATAGSLNWWLRTITGTLFGLGITWFLFTRFNDYFKNVRAKLEPRLRRVGTIK